MTLIKGNALLVGASGKFGDTHVYRKVRGRLQMAATPAPRKKLSAAQKATVGRFKTAKVYAMNVKNRFPELYAEYRKRTTTRLFSAYLVALTDSLNSPIVHYIKTKEYTGVIGDIISVKATDDFRVVRVTVVICDARNKRLESGEAVRELRKPQMWKYKATTVIENLEGVKIMVTAMDHTGNKTMKEVVL